ncbi:MAG: AsmA-like C-terminal domain-containing protein, partial [Alphaproteobacteria bacterium]|nr:AsmA-like C-terminal domain-containing protein [Alphaproteobacteria bacterium]
PVLIDEVQYAPELFSYIKIYADKKHEPGAFWLTGSQVFKLMKGVQESLAGRVAVLSLTSPSQGEIDGVDTTPFEVDKDKLTDNIEKLIKNIAFELNGEKGVVKFSEDSKYDYEISGLILKGDINGNLNKIKINDASLNFDNQKVVLGLEVNGLKEYILNSALNNLKITLSAKVNELKTNEISRFWPKYFGEKAWQWCHDNLAEGIIKNGNFEFIFGYDKKKKSFGFEDLSGTAEIKGGQLTYLETMPKIVDAYGKAVFTDHNIRIDVHKAKSDDVVVNSGYVDLYDLDKNDNFLKLELKGIGSVTDILNLIDHEPLKYPSSIGINSSDIKGTADVSLGLQFELREDLDPQNIKVNVDAVLHDIAIKKAMIDKQVEAKTLDLTLDNQKMTIFGVVNINGQPINLMWNESFVAKEYQRQYQISFSFDDDFKKMMGMNIAALKQPYIKGAIPTKAVVTTYANGKTIIDAHGNLKGTAIDYGFLGFEKKSGVNAEITAQIDLKGNKIFNVPKFTLTKQDFKLNGMIDFDDKGRISDINITDVKGPKTNAKAKISFSYVPEENIKVIVSGYSYDLSDFFSRDEEDVETAKKRRKQLKKNDTEKEENDFENAPNMEVNIAFLKLDYIPKQNKEYLLSIDSNDAGSTLRFLNIYDYIRGGTLSINAKRDANNRFVGYVKARDFNLVNTGVLAKLLTLASFTGILDMLSGDGIAFTHLDVPFEYQNPVLTLDEAKCFGNVIGISGQGQYNNKYQEFDFKGLIAPAYGLNTFLGKIPIVGSLLSGKDGTVFAANYSITGDIDDPQIDISPLSALSPNSIKELWQDTFDDK